MSNTEVHHGDCFEVLPNMPMVDLIFTSPPYEAARTYSIDFKLKGDEYVQWAADRFMACLERCNGLVAWVVEGQTRQFQYSAAPFLLMAELHKRGAILRKPPIYHRVGIPGSGGPDWLRNDYELVICATREQKKLAWSDNTAMGHPPKWAPGGAMSHMLTNGTRKNQRGGSSKSTGGERGVDGVLREAKPRPSHKLHTKREACGKMREQSYTPPFKANPGNVITCKVGGGQMGSKLAHENEAPFPESIAEFFIRSFCPPGGTVLDPFSGSGTTAAVAVKLGRNAIGIDVRESQVDLSTRRISEAVEYKESMLISD